MGGQVNTMFHSKEFIIGVIGAFIGGFFTLVGTLVAHFLENKRDIEKEHRSLKGVLQAFHTELKTLWERYLVTAGNKLEGLQDRDPLLMYWPITQDYFTIYSSNAGKIGEIEDSELRSLIVAAYTKSRGLVDSFRMNNELNSRYEHFTVMANSTRSQNDIANQNAYFEAMRIYSLTLKEQHKELKLLIDDLLHRLSP
jgi:hypothetical protein